MADWRVERPSVLRIDRTDGQMVDDFDPQRAAQRAAELGLTIARFFLENIQHGMFEVEAVNSVPAPVASGSRGGIVTQCADRTSTRLNSSHYCATRMPSSA